LETLSPVFVSVHWAWKRFKTCARIQVSKGVSVDAKLFDRAVSLYSARPDKEWGLTDCISFVLMSERGIAQALTTDRHFEQAGFLNVLKTI
jgi:predicted nucleic acid-binding protein